MAQNGQPMKDEEPLDDFDFHFWAEIPRERIDEFDLHWVVNGYRHVLYFVDVMYDHRREEFVVFHIERDPLLDP